MYIFTRTQIVHNTQLYVSRKNIITSVYTSSDIFIYFINSI